jgi:hypothetical protein
MLLRHGFRLFLCMLTKVLQFHRPCPFVLQLHTQSIELTKMSMLICAHPRHLHLKYINLCFGLAQLIVEFLEFILFALIVCHQLIVLAFEDRRLFIKSDHTIQTCIQIFNL